jgi:hypothetical protein
VVGPKTMAALDSTFHDLVTPPPADDLEIGGDAFGRQPEGDAKVPDAQAVVQAFRANPAGSTWLHLNRATVAADIDSRITSPDLIQQGGNGVCTTAAFVNLWAQDAPDAYARFATTLYDFGAADIAPAQGLGGGLRVTASEPLRGGDYAAIVGRMAAKGLPVPSQADWMVLSAIRDSSNSWVKFTGDPDDAISHYLGDGGNLSGSDLTAWMNATKLYSRVVNDSNVLIPKTVGHAAALDPSQSRCILSINVKMFSQEFGFHSAVLRSRVTLVEGITVDLRLWTWARLHTIQTSIKAFEANYYGATIGFF